MYNELLNNKNQKQIIFCTIITDYYHIYRDNIIRGQARGAVPEGGAGRYHLFQAQQGKLICTPFYCISLKKYGGGV